MVVQHANGLDAANRPVDTAMKRHGKMLIVEEKVFPDRLNDVDSQFKTVQSSDKRGAPGKRAQLATPRCRRFHNALEQAKPAKLRTDLLGRGLRGPALRTAQIKKAKRGMMQGHTWHVS